MSSGLCCTLTSYTIRKNNILHFRMVVPKDIRGILGKRELRLSLRTGYVREGVKKAGRLAGVAQEAFDEIRKGSGGDMAGLEPHQIQALVGEWLKEALEDDERSRAQRKRPRREEDVEKESKVLDIQLSTLRERLATDDHGSAVSFAKDLLEEHGIDFEPDDATFKTLCREMTKAQIVALSVILKRNRGDYDMEDILPAKEEQPHEAEPATPREEQQQHQETPDQGPLMSEILDAYIKEKMDLGDWTEHTRMDNEPMIRDFIEMVGDMPIGALSAVHMRDARDRFSKVPKGRKIKAAYNGKSLRELSDMDIPEEDRYSITTLNNRAIKVGGYLKWLKDRGYSVEDGLISIMRFKKSKKKSAQRGTGDRASFTPEDLGRIFSPSNYLEAVKGQPSRFWVPLVSLCTGMRLEEIAQLYLEDIRKVDGIWCMDINQKADKSRKTEASERLVPVPPALEELGFLEYAECLRTKQEERLFPELSKAITTGKYSHALSKWFNRYIHEKLGIVEDAKKRKKVFHSFRHTFINMCKQLGIAQRKIKQNVGHQQGQDITLDYYADEYKPEILYKEVSCKATPEVDLEPLKEAARGFIEAAGISGKGQ